MLLSFVAVVAGYLVFGVSAGVQFAVTGREPQATPIVPVAVAAVAYGGASAIAGG
jgi:hypothetical protein